jgi:cell wall-associated NlpC family hydrolase
MPWWVYKPNDSVQYSTETINLDPGVWSGPFASKAAAEASLTPGTGTTRPKRPRRGMVSGRLIVTDAMRYRGKVPYLYGGANPRGWDCSGFANWVLGHDLRMTLPGGVRGFNGTSHGPDVLDYAAWEGAETLAGLPSAGDLCLFVGAGPNGHMGFALDSDRMISALDPSTGTAVTPIVGYGPPGAPLIYRRITGAGGGYGLPPVFTGKGGNAGVAALLLVGVVGVVGVLVVLAGVSAGVAVLVSAARSGGS